MCSGVMVPFHGWVRSLATVDLSVFSLLIFIAIIASIVQLVEMIIERFSPSLYASSAFSCRSSP